MTFGPGHIRISYCLTESMNQAAVAAAWHVLSVEERARYDRYRLPRDRRDYAAAHALLRASLSHCCPEVKPHEWIFNTAAREKPELAPSHSPSAMLSFNLSHARGIVACAVASCARIGIDVVDAGGDLDYRSIAAECLSSGEVLQLEALAPAKRSVRLMELWALKEAYTKATGRGFSERWSDFGFAIDDVVRFFPPSDALATAWRFTLFPLEPRYRIAVATDCPHSPIWSLNLSSADGTSRSEYTPSHLLTS